MVPLSMLCQSPVSAGRTPVDAIHDTVALAKLADAAGYHRFWVAEHHSDRALASGAPEVMVAHIAASTQRIRVGSGGVLLPYHAPFHTAEQFNLLAALHPDRIDLGMGRGGGSEAHAPVALGVRAPGPQAFAAADELLSWLGEGSAARPYTDTHASPAVPKPAMPWVLGTSPGSATQAAKRGLPYVFGGFLDPRGLMESLSAYHQNFTPSRWGPSPKVMIAWYVQVGRTTAEAKHEAQSTERWFVQSLLRGENPLFHDPDDGIPYSPMEQMAIAMRRQASAVGTAAEVVHQLKALVAATRCDELMPVSISHDPQARRQGYLALMEAWNATS